MSQLTDNLNAIASIKSDIAAAIESKGVSMTGVSFGSYADKIGEIQTGGSFVTEPLNVTDNGVYTPGQGVDGYSQVTVNVPQSVTGYSLPDVASKRYMTESTISDPNITYIDIGTFAGGRPDYTRNQVVNLPGANTSYFFFPNCSVVQDYGFYYHFYLQSINLPICSYIGYGAFYTCLSLNTVIIPECTYIGSSAFQNCNFSSILLPKCKYIGGMAFYRCQHIESLDLPVCSYIGEYTFAYCSNLSIIILRSTSICNLYNRTAFAETPIQRGSGVIYVPSSLVEEYKSAWQWSFYSSHFLPIPE